MKSSHLIKTLTFAVIVLVGAVGCRKRPGTITPIPGSTTKISNPDTSGPIDPGKRVGTGGSESPTRTPPIQDPPPPVTDPKFKPTEEGIGLPGREVIDGMNADREAFRNETVYFDFDRFAVKASEAGKLEKIADYFKQKQNSANKLRVEGNCDERGTEEYNRSLGERRALSTREFLIKLGVGADRITTISYGEDKPADLGHDEAAWAKNRRAEFVLLKP